MVDSDLTVVDSELLFFSVAVSVSFFSYVVISTSSATVVFVCNCDIDLFSCLLHPEKITIRIARHNTNIDFDFVILIDSFQVHSIFKQVQMSRQFFYIEGEIPSSSLGISPETLTDLSV